MNRRQLIGLGGIAGIALAALLGAAPAQAHNAFVSSNPAAGTVVTEQVGTFVVTTSDALLDSGADSPTTFLQVRGPAETGLYYGDGCATVDGASVTMPAQLGEAGEYTVTWGVVSTDGHPITGDYTFTWQPAVGQDLGDGFAAPPVCGVDPSPSAMPAPATTAPAAPSSPSDSTSEPAAAPDDTSTAAADILWIGAALGILIVAAVVALVVVRMRSRSAGRTDADVTDPGSTGNGSDAESTRPGDQPREQ